MSRWSISILVWAVGFISVAVSNDLIFASQGGAPPSRSTAAHHPELADADSGAAKATVDKYCLTCHNSRSKAGGFTLDTTDVVHVSTSPDLWARVVRKLRDGAMPPPGSPRPDKNGYAQLAGYFEKRLDAAPLNPGHPVARPGSRWYKRDSRSGPTSTALRSCLPTSPGRLRQTW
jgi:mono/diheme cytochrome c family protein